MVTEIVMPNLGFDTQSSRIVEWVKQTGDVVEKGDVIAIVESDKTDVELQSVAGGVLLERVYAAGEEVPVGAVIARIGPRSERPAMPQTAGESPREQPAAGVEASPLARRLAGEHNVDLGRVPGSGPRGRVTRADIERYILEQRERAHPPLARPKLGGEAGPLRALPKVRRAAREVGIDLTRITGTGRDGAITMADLQAVQAAPPPQFGGAQGGAPAAPAPVEPATAPRVPDGAREVPVSRARRAIGRRLSESMREAPHFFYVMGEVDLEAALARRARLPAPQPRVNDLIQYLAVQALRRVPELNATYEDGRLFHYDAVHLGIAVAVDDGLITPVLPSAERYSLAGLAAESRALVERARANRLHAGDLQPGTFTISNLGVVPQVDGFTAVINPPQVAILAVGTVKPRPVVIDGGLHVRRTVHLTVSGDHRVVDGMHLARFMAAFQAELEYFAQGTGTDEPHARP